MNRKVGQQLLCRGCQCHRYHRQHYINNKHVVVIDGGQTSLSSSIVSVRHLSYESYMNSWIGIGQKLANSSTVQTVKDGLIDLHDWSGMSWTVETTLVTIGIRLLITFPLSISQHKILAKYEALKPEINQFGDKLKKEVDSARYLFNWSPMRSKFMFNYRMKQEMKRLIIRDNCHPMKASLVVWFQIPVWIVLSHAIRNMAFMYPSADEPTAQLVYNQLSTEGWLWFTNLTQTDPYYALPLMTAMVNLTIVQIHSNERLRRMGTKTTMHSVITNLGRGLSLLLIPIGIYMPASVTYYWFISSTMGLIQAMILHNEKFKQIIGTNTTTTTTTTTTLSSNLKSLSKRL